MDQERTGMSGQFRTALLAVLIVVTMVVFGLLGMPDRAQAWPGKTTSCTSCHATADTTNAVITTAINGVVGTSVTVSPGGSFEVDARFTNMTPSGETVGMQIAVPGPNCPAAPVVPTDWGIAAGTANSPAIPGWNSVWDIAGSNGAGTSDYFAPGGKVPWDPSGEFPNTSAANSIDYTNGGWGPGGNTAAYDDVTNNPGLDGVANDMGFDAIISVPADTPVGTYDVVVSGIGHVDGGSTKGHITQVITVTVSAGGDTTPPTFGGLTGASDAGSGGTVDLTWAAATDPSTPITYNIYWATSSGGQNFVTPNQTSTLGTGDSVTGLANGTPYYFVVRAEDSQGNEDTNTTEFSATPTAGNSAPDVPTNLAQYLIGGVTPITLGGYTTEGDVVFEADIADSTDGGDTVKLQIDVDSNGTFDCESVLGANPSTNVQVQCPVADGAYDWQARTVDNNLGTSGWVAFNAATPDFTKDASAPVDGVLTATGGNTQIVLTWTAASDAHSGLASPAYTVAMATGTTTAPADCSTGVIYNGDALTHTETTLTNGVDYAFRLCADNNAGLTSSGSTDTAQPAAGCTYSDPTVTILTASKDIATDGGFTDYTVQVTNNDTAACGNTTFNLSVNDTNSTNFYASSLALASLTNLAPGASAQTSFRVTAQANQPNSVTNNTDVRTTADGNHAQVISTAITTTINVSGGGCVAAGNYLNTNGDQLISSRR